MGIPIQAIPPAARTNYIIDQLEGERVTLPGSKGVFRILASSKQTNGGMAVFQSGAVLSDAPGFHWHKEAHDVFLVTKGYLKLWNGDRCRLMGAGDFAYVPAGVIHNPDNLGPHTESLGLVAPGDWIDFFRYVGEEFKGIMVPENDDRDLKSLLIPKLMSAKENFDVNFVRDYDPPALADWVGDENTLPSAAEGPQPYFLRANTGPRWMFGGVMSRPFIHTEQCQGKFAISSIESSSAYGEDAKVLFKQDLTFPTTDHCLVVMEGLLRVKLPSQQTGAAAEWNDVREGQTVVVAAGQPFRLEFASRYVRVVTFTNGPGIEAIVHKAGNPEKGVVLPDEAPTADVSKLSEVCAELGVALGA